VYVRVEDCCDVSSDTDDSVLEANANCSTVGREFCWETMPAVLVAKGTVVELEVTVTEFDPDTTRAATFPGAETVPVTRLNSVHCGYW